MINSNPILFKREQLPIRILIFYKSKERFDKTLESFEKIIKSDGFPIDNNIRALSFLYVNFHKINGHFIDGSFNEGGYLIPKLNQN